MSLKTGYTVQSLVLQYFQPSNKIITGHYCSRSEGNFRLYDQAALSRLQFIRRCRALDITLPEIRQLLALQRTPSKSCHQVNTMIDRRITEVLHKIEELGTLKNELQRLREKCHDDTAVNDCGIMENLIK